MGFWDTVDQEKRKGKGQSSTVGDNIGSFFANTVPKVATDVVKGLYDPINALGEGLGVAAGEFSGANKSIQENNAKSVQAANDTVNILRDQLKKKDLSDEKKKQIQSSIDDLNRRNDATLASQTQEFSTQAEKSDPGHIANNAAQLAINIGTAGAGGAVVGGAKTAAKGAETGLNILTKGEKLAQTARASTIGKAAEKTAQAVTDPQSIKQGLAGFSAVGGAQGALTSADESSNPVDIAGGAATGAILGAVAGGVGGFFGGRGVKSISDTANKGIDAAATQAAESLSKKATPGQVINGDGSSSNVPDINPFQQTTTPVGSGENPLQVQSSNNTQVMAQDAKLPSSQVSNEGPLSLDQMDTIANRPMGSSPADYLREQNKTMAQEVTPGSTDSLTMVLPQEQIDQLGQHIQGMTQKDAQKTLDSLGANKVKDANTTLEDQLTQEAKSTASALPDNVKGALDAIGESTGKLSGDYKSTPTTKQNILKNVSKEWDNVTNSASRFAGKVGADFSDKLQGGAAFKAKFVDETTANVDNIEKHIKDTSMTLAQQKESTKRVADAISKGDTSILKPEDKVLYDNISSMWDKAKAERVKKGRAVKENYVTHVNIDSDSSKTGSLVSALFNKENPDLLSSFSKQQGKNSEPVDNLYTIARKYQQGMANDLAYHDAQKYLADNVDNIPAYLANDSKNMAEFKSYVSDLFDHAINGSSENTVSKAVAKPLNTFTDNVLRFNIGNSLKNYTDQIRTNSLLSKEAKQIKVSDSIAKEFESEGQNFKYGDSTKQELGQNPTRASKIAEFADKISPNLITEKTQVSKNAQKGLQEGFHRSEVYQQAKSEGLSEEAAQTKAWNEDKENVQRVANYISGTSSAGNAMQQVAALRNGKPLLGVVPWSSVTRFASYPINNTMSFIRNMNPKEARALEAYGRGDVMGSKMADIRGNASTLLDMYQNAAKQGDAGIPKEVLDTKIKTIKNAIDLIDNELAKGSNISKGNTAKTYAKIWGATTAIQLAVVGSQDALFGREGSDAKQKGVVGTAITQTPFMDINRIINPVLNGSPLQTSYGQPSVNAKGIVNAIPYVGGVDNATGNNLSKWLNDNVIKQTNKDISSAYN